MAKRLLLLLGLAALSNPIFHSAIYGFQAMFFWTDQYMAVDVPNYDQLGTPVYYALLVIRQFSSFSIPGFIVVSGYFVAFLSRGRDSRAQMGALIQRIKNLLPPLVIWTAITFLLLMRPPDSIRDLLRVYYYIPLLIQFYLLSPFLIPLVRKNWKGLLAAATLLHLVLNCLQYIPALGLDIPGQEVLFRLTPIWLFPERLFWFILGITIGLHSSEMKPWLVRLRPLLIPAALFFGLLNVIEYDFIDRITGPEWLGTNFQGLSREFYALAIVLAFVGHETVRIPFQKGLVTLGGKSLGIYLVNSPAIFVASALIYHLAPKVMGFQPLYQAALIAAGLGGPLLLMELLVRLPAVRMGYRYVFG